MGTQYRYEATPRRKRGIPSGAAVAAVSALVVLLLVGAYLLGATGHIRAASEAEQRPARKITHDSLGPVYTYDGEIMREYVFVDPETGVQYLVNDRGGQTERRDRNGKVRGADNDE